ncbi:MAG TPA: TonB family protein [Terriglobia bacterium]|jgi:TonB family protein
MVGSLVFSLLLSWVQVSSDTYIVKSSAGVDKAKQVLQQLEAFHQLLGTVAFPHAELPELPIEVLLVGDDATLKQLEPEYNGKKVQVAGFYQRGEDRDFIVLSGHAGGLTSVVYHELTHYFLSRGLASRPTWLNEGLAEYFATAEIRDGEVTLGEIPQDRLQRLRTLPLIPLKDLFAVDTSSPYYNESSKAGIFYAEAWAFVHYLMHGEHAAQFKQYLDAMAKGDANLLRFLNTSERDLEFGFQNYVRVSMQLSSRQVIKLSHDGWSMDVQAIGNTDAEMSMAEIFLANGRLPEARRHLESLANLAPDSGRVSYYRGVLARLSGEAGARELFVDALLDPFLGPRAAVQLVELGDWHIPAVKDILEEAAAMNTRNPRVYLALATIDTDEIRELQETVKAKQRAAAAEAPAPPRAAVPEPATVNWRKYVEGSADHVRYQVLSASERHPELRAVVPPYYPAELADQKLSGEVVVDVQITEDGKAGGVWLVSATPELFGTLATAAIREWEFEPVAEKVRVIVQFK